MRKRKDLRTRIFDWVIVVGSWLSIISGIIALLITAFTYQILNWRPYFLYSAIIIAGIIGFRIWVKENID